MISKFDYMRFIRAIAFIFVSVLFFQCQKEVSYIGSPDPVIVTPEPIVARLQGTVLNENGLPAPGVTVKVGAQTATTNARGYFSIKNASLDKKTSVVTAEMTGYFKAYRSFSATSGTNQVIIKLTKKVLAGTVDATTGGSITLTNGAKVVLPAGGIVKGASSTAYTGTVNVYAAYIDPTASDIDQTVPGSFMATDKAGSRVVLSSFGMLAVDLESPAAEKLQIKSGAAATLTTPIPTSLQSSAPASIALWSVDETTGIWKEEGTATKQGTTYVGDVKHFSFWNCDISVNAIVLSMTLKTAAGQPIINGHVRLVKTTPPIVSTHGYTDSLGQVSGYVPSNTPLTMQVIDQCGNVVYQQNVGPFSTTTNLGVITVNPSNASSIITFSGQLTTCGGAPLAGGYAIISIGTQIFYAGTDASGNYSGSFVMCSGTVSQVNVIGWDETGQVQSAPYNLVPTSSTINVPVISACGTSSAQYVTYSIDGTAYSYNNMGTDSLQAYTQQMQGTTLYSSFISAGTNYGTGGTAIYFNFFHPTLAAGTYQVQTLSVGTTVNAVPVQPFNIVLTHYPALVGEFYEGTFSGSYTLSGVPHTITNGVFRVRRTF